MELDNCELFVLLSIGHWNLTSLRNVSNLKKRIGWFEKKGSMRRIVVA